MSDQDIPKPSLYSFLTPEDDNPVLGRQPQALLGEEVGPEAPGGWGRVERLDPETGLECEGREDGVQLQELAAPDPVPHYEDGKRIALEDLPQAREHVPHQGYPAVKGIVVVPM